MFPPPLPLSPHLQVPKEAYAEFAKSGARGAAARKAWEEVRAAYAEKYPEEYAEFESISTGKLPANWAEKLPKFTSEGERGRGSGGVGEGASGEPSGWLGRAVGGRQSGEEGRGASQCS